jgi:hypothetical protein
MTDTTMSDVPAPPYDNGDDEPEFRPRPRRRAHVLTFVLAGAVLVASGFYGGVLVQKHEDRGSSSATGAAARARAFAAAAGTTGAEGTGARNGGAGLGGFGGGGAGGGAVTGTVKLVDGKNVYVTDTSGNVVKVATSGSSELTKTVAATTKDVAPGDVVIVRGTQNSDGSYTASTLVVSSAGALGGAVATPSG